MIKLKNFCDIQEEANAKNKKLYEICQILESENTELPVQQVRENVKNILSAMKSAIKDGLKS